MKDDNPASPTTSPTLLEIAVRQAGGYATMTFNELVAGCTADEREQLAWHLAQMRARKTYEALKAAKP